MSRRSPAGQLDEGELRLLPTRFVPMSEREEEQLLDALAELLVEWLELHPERLPGSLRPSDESGLLDDPSSKEER